MHLIDDVHAILEAASISTTFTDAPERIALQVGQVLQGEPSTGRSQFTALAKIFATEVLPVPLVPVNR